MNELPPEQLKSDEKLVALFCHLSLFLGGIVLPIIFWAVNREKSKFVTFHSLQAIFFHISYIVIIIAFAIFFVFGGMGFGLLFAGATKHTSSGPSLIFLLVMIVFYGLFFVIIFGAIGYAIYMGVKAYQGKLNKYPIIGNIIYKKVYGI